MSEWVSPGVLTPGVLLALGVLWVLSGRLIPRRTVEQMRADLTTQIGDWKAAYRIEVERNKVLADQLDEVLSIPRRAVAAVTPPPGGTAVPAGGTQSPGDVA